MLDKVPGYDPLVQVFRDAIDQATQGKGKERHANDLSFLDQPIFTIANSVGEGFLLGQAIKKTAESTGMVARGQYSAAQAELLGAMVYLAAAHIFIGEKANLHDQR